MNASIPYGTQPKDVVDVEVKDVSGKVKKSISDHRSLIVLLLALSALFMMFYSTHSDLKSSKEENKQLTAQVEKLKTKS